jgi:copper chaperone CopZ
VTEASRVRVYLVPDVSCRHCKTAIESAVASVAGVDGVDVSIDEKLVTVTGGAADDAIRAAIEGAGYDLGPDPES